MCGPASFPVEMIRRPLGQVQGGQEMHLIERTQDLGPPLENVFRFFQRPENLQRLTPPWLQFRILTPGLEAA
jgi:hypothetical protein